MKRNANAVKGGIQRDHFTFSMTSIKQLAGVFVPKSLGDVVDKLFWLVSARYPLGTNGERVHAVCIAFISPARDSVRTKEFEVFADLWRFFARDRDKFDIVLTGQLGDSPCRITTNEEEGIHCTIAHPVSGLIGFEIFRFDIIFGEAIAVQDDLRINEGARAGFVHGDAFALQIGNAVDAGICADHEVDAFGIEVGDGTQFVNGRFAFPDAGSCIGPGRNVGLREARFKRAASNGVDIGNRAVGRQSRGNKTRNAARATFIARPRSRGIRNRVGKKSTNRIVGSSCPACGRYGKMPYPEPRPRKRSGSGQLLHQRAS